MSANQGQEQTRRANVRLARGKKPVAVDGPVNIGAAKPIHLPSEEEQRRGFYVENPEVLITQFYPTYKHFVGGVTSVQAAAEGQPPQPPKGEGEGREDHAPAAEDSMTPIDEGKEGQQDGATQV